MIHKYTSNNTSDLENHDNWSKWSPIVPIPTSSKRFYFGPINNKTSICWDIMSVSDCVHTLSLALSRICLPLIFAGLSALQQGERASAGPRHPGLFNRAGRRRASSVAPGVTSQRRPERPPRPPRRPLPRRRRSSSSKTPMRGPPSAALAARSTSGTCRWWAWGGRAWATCTAATPSASWTSRASSWCWWTTPPTRPSTNWWAGSRSTRSSWSCARSRKPSPVLDALLTFWGWRFCVVFFPKWTHCLCWMHTVAIWADLSGAVLLVVP